MTHNNTETRPSTGAGSPPSKQVNWYEVYRFVECWATSSSTYGLDLHHPLIAGTPQWCALPDHDARKLLAVLIGGVREALSNDIHQVAMADASRQIANSENWSAIAQRVRNGRGDRYIPRKAS